MNIKSRVSLVAVICVAELNIVEKQNTNLKMMSCNIALFFFV